MREQTSLSWHQEYAIIEELGAGGSSVPNSPNKVEHLDEVVQIICVTVVHSSSIRLMVRGPSKTTPVAVVGRE